MNYIQRTELETRKFRLLALTAAALALYLRPGVVPLWPAVSLILAYFLYVMVLGALILPRVKSANFVYVMALVDTVTLGGGLFLTGVQSPLFILLPLFIVYYSIFQGYRTSVFTATTFSLMYVAITFNQEARTAGSIIAIQVPFLYLIALLGGYLSQRRLEERKEKEELQELIRVEARARHLLEMARKLTPAWEPEAVLQRMAEGLPQLSGLPGWVIALIEDGRLQPRKASFPLQRLSSWNGKDRTTSLALEQGKPVTLANAMEHQEDLPLWARQMKVSSLLVLPLVTQGERLGVAYLFDTSEKRELSPDVLSLVKSYGEMVSEALANARLHQTTRGRVQELVGELEQAVKQLERAREARRRPELAAGDLRLDGARGRAFLGGRTLDLSRTEFELLYSLAEDLGRPVNQETLLRRVWGREFTGASNVVDVSIHRLRKKLGQEERILTIRGKGYMLVEK